MWIVKEWKTGGKGSYVLISRRAFSSRMEAARALPKTYRGPIVRDGRTYNVVVTRER